MYIERFRLIGGVRARYVLRVQPSSTGNGQDPLVTLTLNGRSVSPTTQQVQLADSNTIEAVVQGPEGTIVTLTVLSSPDPTYTVYGPRRFDRGSGAPAVVTDRFVMAATAAAPYAIHLINGTSTGTGRASSAVVRLNGAVVLGPADFNQQVAAAERDVTLRPDNAVEVEVRSAPGSFISVRFTATDVTPPVIELSTPAQDFITKQLEVEVTGTIHDETATTLTVNGVTASVTDNRSFTATVALPTEGANTITVVAVDAAGNRSETSRHGIRDTQPPVIAATAPTDGLVTRETTLTAQGTVIDATAVTVAANGFPLPVDAAGVFSGTIAVNEGVNFISIVATDAAGNSATVVRSVIRDTHPPVLALLVPATDETTEQTTQPVQGTVTDETNVVVTVNEGPVAIGPNGAFATTVALVSGSNPIVVQAEDAAGNVSTLSRTVTRVGTPPPPPIAGEGELLPIDSMIGAPALDLSGVTSLGDASRFLYEGPEALQSGVTPGAISEFQVAVIRGRVLQRDSTPLDGVEVSVRDHPEFGSTHTRANGVFDIVANGGGPLVLDFNRAGFIPVQRHVPTEWRDFAVVDDVVMVGLDASVTLVDFTSPVQVARGKSTTDEDGTRRATLMFKQGTSATAVLPDGSQRSLPALHVRATEYTVGPLGPQAMPGELPATSGYTYAVELSADEALAAGATSVRFSKPVSVYVENFLNLGVGSIVPVGSYDRDGTQWVPSQDAVVVKVLGVTDGLADLDTDGSGTAASGTDLAQLGFDNAERQALAGVYSPGQSVWRARISHFTPIDLNLLWECLTGTACTPIADPEPDNGEPINGGMCPANGSVIECQNQILGERLRVTGTSVTLNYRSDRAPGRIAARQLRLRLVGPTVPAGLQRVDLQVEVAGRRFIQRFAPAPDLQFTYAWDGRDAYGRIVQGVQPAEVRIAYSYASQPLTRRRNREGAAIASFAARPCLSGYAPFEGLSPCQATGGGVSRSRGQITLWRTYAVSLGSWDARALALGGWTPDPVHFYDNVSRTIHLGNGSRRRAETVNTVVTTVAGTGVNPTTPSGDGGLATAVAVVPLGTAIAPNGEIYFTDGCRIRRVDRSGRIWTVVGSATASCTIFPGGREGVRDARTVGFGQMLDVLVASDNTVYFSQPCAVWRLVRDTTAQHLDSLTIVAGYLGFRSTGFAEFICEESPEGSIARGAKIGYPSHIALAPDGSLYIADSEFGVIRRVGLDGRIFREVSNLAAGLLAYGPDGSVYFVRSNSQGGYTVRRLLPDGREQIVAGNGTCAGTAQDGIPARQASLCFVAALAVDGAGNLHISTVNRLRVVGSDGIITTLAGTGTGGFNGDGRVGLQTQVTQPRGLTVGPDGAVYFKDQFRLRRVAATMPGFAIGEIVVPSEDGSELYRFTSRGRHLETINTLTGARLWQFAYDTAGRIESLTDGDGNLTRFLRDATGEPTEIVAPFGQQTSLGVTTAGYLSSIRNPAGETTFLSYGSGGLLATMKNPLGHEWRFEYDASGRLTRDSDPAGGSVTLSRSDSTRSFGVTKTSALGRTTRYGVQRDRVGAVNMGNTFPSRAVASVGFGTDATRATQLPDGSVATQTLGPDPRWGFQGPITSNETYTIPGGLSATVQRSSRAQLATSGNPLSLTRLTDTVKVNGLAYVRVYDAATREVTVTSPAGRHRRLRLDALGRLAMIQPDPALDSTVFTYDAVGRLTERQTGSVTERLSYDTAGYLAAFTDRLGRTTRYTHDAAGRVTSSTTPGGNLHRLGYDAAGRMTSVTMPSGAVHALGYSPVGINTSYTPPGNAPYTTIANADRQWASTTLPSGRKIEASYDAAGRIVSSIYPEARVNYAYVGGTQLLSRVTRISAASDSQVVAYTYQGSLPTRIKFSGAANGEYVYTYDNNFRVSSRSLDGGPPMQFAYDKDGLLVRQGPFTLQRGGPMGAVSSMTDGRLLVTYAYDRRGRPIHRTHSVNGAVFYDLSLTYDDAERVATRDEVVAGEQRSYRYSYDVEGRLIEVLRNGVRVETYGYDVNGNRTRKEIGGVVESAAYDAQDRILSQAGVSYEHDEDGFLRQRGRVTFAYSARGELIGTLGGDGSGATYLYDGFQRLVAGGTASSRKSYLYGDPYGDFRLTATRAESGESTEYLYDDSGDLIAIVTLGKWFYTGCEPVGTPVSIVDESGKLQAVEEHDAWGGLLSTSDPSFELSIGFAGGIENAATGLVRFGSRDYEVASGRWTTRDRSGLLGGEVNLYLYSFSDPINYRDRDGNSAVELAAGALFGLYGQYLGSALTFTTPTTQQLLRAAVLGAALAIPFEPGLLFLLGASGNLISQLQENHRVNWCEVVAAGGLSYIGGVIGGGLLIATAVNLASEFLEQGWGAPTLEPAGNETGIRRQQFIRDLRGQ